MCNNGSNGRRNGDCSLFLLFVFALLVLVVLIVLSVLIALMVSLLLYLFLVLPVLQFVLLSSPSALPLWRRSSWGAAAGSNGLPVRRKAALLRMERVLVANGK